MTPGELIRAARIAAPLARRERFQGRKVPHLTQDELAMRLGTCQGTISAFERGMLTPSPAFVAQVITACRLPEGWTP